MENFFNHLDSYLLIYASIIASLMLFMVVFTIVDYIKFMTPYWRIEKKYKRELELLRKNGSL
tara:strand:+ start:283 stop:468 length:186 start_codon:yes stop_codon:yes gene_type:complete